MSENRIIEPLPQVQQTTEPIRTLELGKHQKLTILGTAHVSQASADKVKELIATQVFDAVAIELCPSRYSAIINPNRLAKMDLFQVVKKGQVYMVAASLALGAFQQRLAENLGVEPGAEMRTAIREAQAAGLPVLLIDREIGITLKRIYRNFPWWRRLNLFAGLLSSILSRDAVSKEEIERLKHGDVLQSTFTQLAEDQCDLYQPLITERDEYMSARLLQETEKNDYQHTLVVVGAGHLKGISEILQTASLQSPDETVRRLDIVPQPVRWSGYIPWIIAIFVLTGFGVGFQRSPDIGLTMIIDWIMINGTLAAIGAAAALAHPLTVLTAFVVAPFTSFIPMISAGMVAAMVEVFLRKPHMSDFSHLRQDAARLKGWWQNQVTRTLLVFLLASLGSALGTYIAGFRILDYLTES